jgi:hypothetical protein
MIIFKGFEFVFIDPVIVFAIEQAADNADLILRRLCKWATFRT